MDCDRRVAADRKDVSARDIRGFHPASPGQRRDAGQLAAFQPFEEGAAGGRDIGELLGHLGYGERGHRIAAAGDAEQPAGSGKCSNPLRHRHRGPLEGTCFEGAQRPVPDEGAGFFERGGDPVHGLRADIEDHHVARDRTDRDDLGRLAGCQCGGDDGVFREDHATAALAGKREEAARIIRHVALAQRAAHFRSLGEQQGVGHRPADHQEIHLADNKA
jgi:hypothetical protein